MALSIIWISFILIAFVMACYQYVLLGNQHIFENLVNGLFESANLSVMKIALPLVGIMAFWLGIMRIAEKAGLINTFSRWLHPLVSSLFPSIPRQHPAVGHMMMNFSANLLGLDNAATPFGLRAMQSLQDINPRKSVASNEQIMFILLHASGLTLIPVSVMAQRSIYGAMNPSDVFIPIAISTTFTTLVSVVLTALIQKLRFSWKFILMLGIFIGLLAGSVSFLYAYAQSGEQEALSLLDSLPPMSELTQWSLAHWSDIFPFIQQWKPDAIYPLKESEILSFKSYYVNTEKNQFNLLFSNVILLLIPIGFILYALRKRCSIFEDFVDGAKESFGISLKIIPYLVGLLVAIGLLRSSGAIDLFVAALQHVVVWLGLDDAFVPSLSTALMKPLSGSGARAMMIETMDTYGADSFVGRLSCIFQGTSDTLIYVVALYFGSVGIRSTRYIVPLGLLVDAIGIVGAIAVGYWFFG